VCVLKLAGLLPVTADAAVYAWTSALIRLRGPAFGSDRPMGGAAGAS